MIVQFAQSTLLIVVGLFGGMLAMQPLGKRRGGGGGGGDAAGPAARLHLFGGRRAIRFATESRRSGNERDHDCLAPHRSSSGSETSTGERSVSQICRRQNRDVPRRARYEGSRGGVGAGEVSAAADLVNVCRWGDGDPQHTGV